MFSREPSLWESIYQSAHDAFEVSPLLVLATLLTAGLFAYWISNLLFRLPGSPPVCYTWPIVGDSPRYIADAYQLQEERHAKYGPVFTHSLFGSWVTQISDVDAARKMLSSEHNLVEADFAGCFEVMLGERSLSCTHGPPHVKLRKILNPAFAPGRVAEYLPDVVDLCQESIDRWLKIGHFNAKKEINAFTFKVAAKVILGFNNSWLEEAKLRTVQQAFVTYTAAMFNFLPKFMVNVPGNSYQPGLKARKFLTDTIDENLDLIKKDLNDSKSANVESKQRANVARTLLQHMDSEGDDIDMKTLEEQCLNVLWAAHETTASTIILMLLRIKQSPHVLDALRSEQKQIVAEHGKEITDTAVRDMEYAEAVCKETLRLNPIVGSLFRKALRDFEVCGFRIRKGTKMWVTIGRFMRELDERWKGSPKFPLGEFHPERWLTKDGRSSGAYFMPFGSGVRMCLGMNLGMAEMKILLAMLARQVDWAVDDINEKINAFPIPSPVNGLPMKMWAM